VNEVRHVGRTAQQALLGLRHTSSEPSMSVSCAYRLGSSAGRCDGVDAPPVRSEKPLLSTYSFSVTVRAKSKATSPAVAGVDGVANSGGGVHVVSRVTVCQ